MFSGESVTLVNRTSGQYRKIDDEREVGRRTLIVKYNGREFRLKPGKNHGVPIELVPYAKNQNPVMGTQAMDRPSKFRSLVAVEGKEDCSLVVEDPDQIERLDRTTAKGIGRTAVKMLGDPVTVGEARVADIESHFSGGEGFIDGASASDGVSGTTAAAGEGGQ